MPRFSDDNPDQDREPPQSPMDNSSNDKLLFTGPAAATLVELRENEDTEPRVLTGVKCEGEERTIVDVDQIAPVSDTDEIGGVGRLDQSLTVDEDTNEVQNVAASIDEDLIVIPNPEADTAYHIMETDGQYSISGRLAIVLAERDRTDPSPRIDQPIEAEDPTPEMDDTARESLDETPTPAGLEDEEQPTIETAQTEPQEPRAGQSTDDEVIHLDINREVTALSTMFSDISRDDFYRLDNGNIGAEVSVIPSSDVVDQIDIVIEYTGDFPEYPPCVWVLHPNLSSDHDTVVEVDQRGDARIQYVDASTWAQYRDTRVALDYLRDWIIRYCQQQEQHSAGDVVRETTEYVADRGEDFIQDIRDRRGNDRNDDSDQASQ